MKTSVHPRCLIQENARRIRELHRRNSEAADARNDGPEAAKAHSKACHELHTQYDGLAFPGGWNAALKRLKAGECRDVEAGLAFLEVRPYFFRSQYIWKKLAQLLKRIPLNRAQQERLQRVFEEAKQRKTGRA